MTTYASYTINFDESAPDLWTALGISAERKEELARKTLEPLARMTVKRDLTKVQAISLLLEEVPDLQEFVLCLQAFEASVLHIRQGAMQHRIENSLQDFCQNIVKVQFEVV